MLLPNNNKQLAKKYFDTLPASDVNKKYYDEGLKYESPTSFLGTFVNYF